MTPPTKHIIPPQQQCTPQSHGKDDHGDPNAPQMENAPLKFTLQAANSLADRVNFAENGLIAAVAQDVHTNDILMLAWVNRPALVETLTSGRACYWSRSRQKLWKKGEESGQFQYVREIYLDCDRDAIIMRVDQVGVACHTGRQSCFYHQADITGIWQENSQPLIDPSQLYKK